jgi:hypothetical protein
MGSSRDTCKVVPLHPQFDLVESTIIIIVKLFKRLFRLALSRFNPWGLGSYKRNYRYFPVRFRGQHSPKMRDSDNFGRIDRLIPDGSSSKAE